MGRFGARDLAALAWVSLFGFLWVGVVRPELMCLWFGVGVGVSAVVAFLATVASSGSKAREGQFDRRG